MNNLSKMFRQYVDMIRTKSQNFIGDHPVGLALLHKEKNIQLVMIPKNASTSVSMAMLEQGWTPVNFLDKTDSRYIVILRDPAERFISAVNMFLTSTKPLDGSLPIISNGMLNTEDCHFQPQYKFFADIPKDKIDFFKYSINVVNDISSHYNLNLGRFKMNVSTSLFKTIDDSIIKTLYAEDYKLINSVKFVNV